MTEPEKILLRPCPICDSDNLHMLGRRKMKHGNREWEHRDAICLECRMVFDALIHDPAWLDSYYNSGNYECAANYHFENRIALIKRYLYTDEGDYANGKVYDIGNDKYMQGCVESQGWYSKEKPPYDIVTCYYVLEHVQEPLQFLMNISSVLLKLSGVLIVEVPDFMRYPDIALFPEHLQYFTPSHLEQLLSRAGFDVIECINGHSRAFGVAMVAIKYAYNCYDREQMYHINKTAYGATCNDNGD